MRVTGADKRAGHPNNQQPPSSKSFPIMAIMVHPPMRYHQWLQ